MPARRRVGLGLVAGAAVLLLAAPLAGAAPGAPPPARPADVAAVRAPAPPARCPAAAVTIRGTLGSDRLVGTPGPDVIDAGTGDDVVDGLGGDDTVLGGTGNDTLLGGDGNDVLCGGTGNDVVLGAAGADVVLGEEGDDLVSASYGDDGVNGGAGNDVVAGGPGDDDLRGDVGNDALGGGVGDDRMAGDLNDDRLSGADGNDQATGGLNRDRCAAERATECEAPVEPTTLTASLVRDPVEQERPPGYRLDWTASASAGLRLVEIYANDRVVDQVVTTGRSRTGTSTIPLDRLPSGPTQLYVVATDTVGEQVASEARTVDSPGSRRDQPPSTNIVLNRPTPIATLVQQLTAAGLTPVEYRARNVPGPPPVIDPEVTGEITAAGLVPFVGQDMAVLYTPRGTVLSAQPDDLAAYYAEQGITGAPMISSVVVEGVRNQAGIGPVGGIGRVDGTTPGGSARPGEPTADVGPGPDSPPATARRAPAVPNALVPAPPKTGRTAEEASPGLASLRSLAAAPTSLAYWPRVGRTNTETSEHRRYGVRYDCLVPFFPACGLVPYFENRPEAEFQHQLVWPREVLQGFADRQAAYEHNLKVRSPGRGGTRPACNPFTDDDFYVRAEESDFTYSNVPDSVGLYNDDVIAEDGCDSNEVSFGLIRPEKLADGVPAGQVPVTAVQQNSERNDDADRTFRLSGQTLSRTNYGCDRVPDFAKKYCIGVDTSQTRDAPLARTGGQIGDVGLPACVVYSGYRFTPDVSAERSRECGRDRDRDGFDDQIDCAPDDPAINPGAVDVPNDGIDQNCDGSDLIVGSGEIQVTLVWNNDNDQDLHVYEPDGREIWYAARGPTATGGLLDRDDNVAACGNDATPGGVENVFWPTGSSPARGTYRVDVVQYSSCGTPAQWSAQVKVGGQLVATRTGTGTGSFTFDY